MVKLSYKVKISCHEPPFKWQVVRNAEGYGPGSTTGTIGEADTRQEAFQLAHAAALEMEHKRIFDGTVLVEDLFEVESEIPQAPPIFESVPDTYDFAP